MSIIKNRVAFDKSHLAIIKTASGDWDLTHNTWDCKELLPIRTHIRNFYSNEQGNLCAYCRNETSYTSALNAHVEHIIAKSINNKFLFEPKNLCVICADCNTLKGKKKVANEDDWSHIGNPKRYPRSSNAFRVVHPHLDNWDEHLVNISGIYIDLTDKGAFTIKCCVLNRKVRKYGYDGAALDEKALLGLVTRMMLSTNEHEKRAIKAVIATLCTE